MVMISTDGVQWKKARKKESTCFKQCLCMDEEDACHVRSHEKRWTWKNSDVSDMPLYFLFWLHAQTFRFLPSKHQLKPIRSKMTAQTCHFNNSPHAVNRSVDWHMLAIFPYSPYRRRRPFIFLYVLDITCMLDLHCQHNPHNHNYSYGPVFFCVTASFQLDCDEVQMDYSVEREHVLRLK